MIKLIDIINENQPDIGGEEAWKMGYKSIKHTTDPETGQMDTTYEALPIFHEIRRELLTYRKEIQPFKYSANADVAKISKDINTILTKASTMVFALDKMLELQRKLEREKK